MMYQVEYARERKQFEEVVEDKGVTVLIDPTAVMFLIGAEMDYTEDKFQAGFVFNNPNETDRCGCGESFRVA
jgi:iron-sulfur cluster assembly protein